MKSFKFIDLFAGLGGFHLAASALGGKCVFASEIQHDLRNLYLQNYGLFPAGDINEVKVEDIPDHDLLCAGFPCQPFSKAGGQKGWKDKTRGTLFFVIAQIIEAKRPQFIVLENVANFLKHDSGNTYREVVRALEELGYAAKSAKLSPHSFGIPQHRDRMYIVAQRRQLEHFSWPIPSGVRTNIADILEDNASPGKPLSDLILSCLSVWQDFIDRIGPSTNIPTYPIWSMEFGATYPLDKPIGKQSLKSLRGTRGSFGASLAGLTRSEIEKSLPSHALREIGFPVWKVRFIERNRTFFSEHREALEGWIDRIQNFHSSLQKLEWNDMGGDRDVFSHLIQVRASGIRIKKTTYSPALVAASDSQIPIVGWKKRYLTVMECARLQNMSQIELPSNIYQAYAALGNAVNAQLVQLIMEQLVNLDAERQPLKLLHGNLELIEQPSF